VTPLADKNAIDNELALARRTRRHQEMLVICVAVVALAFLLEVHADQRVAFRFLPGWPLPETCPSRTLLHVDCPGCGLTRSFVHLAHGDWRASWNIQRVGMLLALAVVLQIPYRIAALLSPGGLPLGTSFPKFVGWLLVTLLFVNWLANLIARCTQS
jgi:Protein of unknown function (DUF2752)